jgi:hypothetical protein
MSMHETILPCQSSTANISIVHQTYCCHVQCELQFSYRQFYHEWLTRLIQFACKRADKHCGSPRRPSVYWIRPWSTCTYLFQYPYHLRRPTMTLSLFCRHSTWRLPKRLGCETEGSHLCCDWMWLRGPQWIHRPVWFAGMDVVVPFVRSHRRLDSEQTT